MGCGVRSDIWVGWIRRRRNGITSCSFVIWEDPELRSGINLYSETGGGVDEEEESESDFPDIKLDERLEGFDEMIYGKW